MTPNERREADRSKAWGQDYKQSFMDRFGIWLSSVQIRRRMPTFRGKDVADVGCGYHAAFSRSLRNEARSLTVIDMALSDELKAMPNVIAIEGVLPDVLDGVPSSSVDIILCNNVLEHLWEPARALARFRQILRPGGACFVNVPSWKGKVILETAAFKLGLTSKDEINDHKAYYEPRELWSLVVRSGFKPSQVFCASHKFGLNTFAVCTIE